jgi:hypothetical protein
MARRKLRENPFLSAFSRQAARGCTCAPRWGWVDERPVRARMEPGSRTTAEPAWRACRDRFVPEGEGEAAGIAGAAPTTELGVGAVSVALLSTPSATTKRTSAERTSRRPQPAQVRRPFAGDFVGRVAGTAEREEEKFTRSRRLPELGQPARPRAGWRERPGSPGRRGRGRSAHRS